MTKHEAGLHCQDTLKGGCEKKENTQLLQDTRSNVGSSYPPPPPQGKTTQHHPTPTKKKEKQITRKKAKTT